MSWISKRVQLSFRFRGWATKKLIDSIIPCHIDLFIGKHQFWMQPKDIFTSRFVGYFETISFTVDIDDETKEAVFPSTELERKKEKE